ncbi:MAG: decaprenyl-phosphate phosphoribosyltransferase [Solirubrobacterales bacterium]
MESLTRQRPAAAEMPPATTPTGRRSTPHALLVAMRPQEWVKNLLVFAGLIFSRQFDEAEPLAAALLTFAAFCAISSAGYLLNDLRDAELDRRHPEKRRRPIATGELTPRLAAVAGVVLAAGALGLGFAVEPEVAALVAGYGLATAAYTLVLKRIVILDVMTIAGLFILRVIAGAVAVEVQASEWLLLCTGMLALFLGFTKRRQEAMQEELGEPGETRPVLEHYSLPFLDQMISMVTAAAIISYAVYAVDSPFIGSEMLATAPPVLYGIFRYLYLIYDRADTRSTAEILTRDPGMIVAAVVWVGTALLLLYTF